jgi:hypothetical protein
MGKVGFFLGVKRQRFETDRSPPANAEIKNVNPLFLTYSWSSVSLIEHRGRFTF